MAERPPPAAPVTIRAIFLGLALIPPNILWIVWIERFRAIAYSTTASLFFTVVFSLLLVMGLNAPLKRFAPRRALQQGELLTVYSLLSLGTAMAGVDFISPLITVLAHGFRFATPANGWERLWPLTPTWLTVRDKAALQGFYEGHSSFYTPAALKAWIPPLLCWTLLLLALLWTMACLNTLLRAQWSENERLSFPIVQLPLAMTAPEGTLFKNRLFWLGAALAGGYNLLNGLHFLIPTIPAFTFNGYDIGTWFRNRPWNAMGYMGGGWHPVGWFPFLVGLGYLLSTDLLFSCWFFYWFFQIERVIVSAQGWQSEGNRLPYVDEQMFGGYLAVTVFALWSARGHLAMVWRRAMADAPEAEAEPLRYRTALVGALAGFALVVGGGWLAGLPPLVSVLFFLIYFAIAVAVTRMRAELGPPTHDLHFIGPNQILTTALGTANLGAPALGVFALAYGFNRAYRCHPMPHQLEGFWLARAAGVHPRRLVPAMLAAGLLGIVCSSWFILDLSYRLGAASHSWLGAGDETWGKLSSQLSNPRPPDTKALLGMAAGFATAAVLSALRRTVPGFPLHALGFSLSGGWSMMWAWLSLFIAWVIKASILRYSGLRGFRAGLPFFFGVILADMTLGALWTLLGLLLDIPVYSVWSG